MKQQPQRVFWDKDVLKVEDFSDFCDFQSKTKSMMGSSDELDSVRRLVVSGSTINSFHFLKLFSSLEQLAFLACDSDQWDELSGTANIISLRLHNLKQGKRYLPSLGFLRTFPKLQYLYLNLLGIDDFSELHDAATLHTLFSVLRNENIIKNRFDLSALEFLPRLKVFNTWMTVDRHRIPAESIIPVLKNSSIFSVTVTQMYATEDKKLKKLIEEINPKLSQTTLTHEELHKINLNFIAW